MRFKMKQKYSFFILLVILWFMANGSPVQGARVAGEEGVTPVTPGSEQTVQTPPKPVGTEPAAVRPERKEPDRSEPKNNKKETQAGETKSPEEKKPEKRYVTIDFDNVDMAIFIKFISELTGTNFVIDKAVSGKVTVISPTKISVEEAYKVFESVLEVYGYATVPAGNITKIVPAAKAKSKNIETRLKRQAISPEDKVVTQLIPLRYADPNELKKLFTPFISKNSLIVPYAPTGTLIVTDVLSNINRLIKIIDEIDVAGIGEEISVIPLEYATASVLTKSLNTVFQRRATAAKGKKGPTGGGAIRITSDERTNALIILASEDDARKVKQLIKLLDTEIPRGEGDIHVYYLQNANAEDLASVLKAIPSDQKAAAKKGKAPVISKDVQIVADKATNSLVITAKKSDYLALEGVIKKLDIPRRMVYIEALLMEVSVEKDFAVGVEWRIGKDIGSYQGKDVGAFAGSTAATSQIPANPLAGLPRGLALGVLGESIEIGGITFPSIQALIRAYEGDSDVHILSTPQIMTTDNEEAEIIVADNIPYLTSLQTSTAEVDYSNYEFKDVGVTLKITPQINQERFVRLKIYQEVSQVVAQQTEGLPTTLKRQTKTTVVIKDGHTVVIGGLIDETLSQTTSSTPCLGNVPVLGWLFKSKGNSGDKTNLYIFITPHIIENPEEAQEVYEEKRDDIEGIKEGVIKLYKTPWSDGQEVGKEEEE
ncbi:MAG: type II secretion system secretin GspD [Deltaproteobacteria bacterium]|nr:type II secretion system secretin GspD [Deltaproteobacteria bacterium]